MTPKPAKRDTSSQEAAEKPPTFEEALERLESIVREMEQGSLRLEEMLARFEEGQKLIVLCTRTLNEVERRIEILVKKGNVAVAEPFEGEVGEEAPAGDEGAG